jgi:hypothetical protein
MSENPLVKKLKIKPGQRIIVLNPPSGYIAKLKDLPDGVELVSELDGTFDFIQLFVNNVAELEEFAPKAINALKYDGIFWICYPKRSSKIKTDINRDVGWEVIDRVNLKGVAQISIDETWSALRFRPADRVGVKQ